KYGSPDPEILRPILDLIVSAIMVRPTETPAICRDPSDDKFHAAAKAGGASFIISEDRDLLDLERYEGIRIVDAETFVRVLETGVNLGG
ncbi:MAG: hypothetical protein H0T18_06330, partial [Chloroflexia bacterium]|nr:hypothetical protein [Chloroflexia bacterium]